MSARAAGPDRTILSINTGSSSLKFALFRFSNGSPSRLAEGGVTGIGLQESHLSIRFAKSSTSDDRPFANHEAAMVATLTAIRGEHLPEPDAIGHRLVHGGPVHFRPERVDPTLLASLRQAVPFAPLHLPAELRGIELCAARFPGIPQVACFDTAFHAGIPEVAQRLPLPRSLHDQGIRRYGFHGLSYEHVVSKVGRATLGRAVLAHLGNGVSLAAVRDGVSMDTTMGLTPTGGVMMGTRTGDLDPGVLLHLLHAGYDASRLERTIEHESGLLGVSGTTSDMKTLLEHRTTDPRAALAIEMFAYQIRKAIGSFAAVLGGIDTLVFTGGIGEHGAPIRTMCCAGLQPFGIELDEARNASSASVISSDAGACTVRVVPTDEELVIALHTLDIAHPSDAT